MKKVLKSSRFFLLLFFLFAIAGVVIILITEKGPLFVKMNGFHGSFGDALFPWITWLGHGLAFLVIVLVSILKNYRMAILGFLSYISSGLISQFFKKVVFPDFVRPVRYFEQGPDIYIIEGMHPHTNFSFPSGHAASAFALGLFLTILFDRPKLGIIFCTLSIAIGYSRVYIAQHFFEDVYFGAWIGVITTLMVFLLLSERLKKHPVLNKGLVKQLGS